MTRLCLNLKIIFQCPLKICSKNTGVHNQLTWSKGANNWLGRSTLGNIFKECDVKGREKNKEDDLVNLALFSEWKYLYLFIVDICPV